MKEISFDAFSKNPAAWIMFGLLGMGGGLHVVNKVVSGFFGEAIATEAFVIEKHEDAQVKITSLSNEMRGLRVDIQIVTCSVIMSSTTMLRSTIRNIKSVPNTQTYEKDLEQANFDLTLTLANLANKGCLP